ncbi:MAG: RHS repeat-associated core domain-containing protein, partial [Betaproteobacteria bacterium]
YDETVSGASVYNYFRDYSPDIGRYIQSDPIGLYGGTNTFGYVGGAPLSRIDPLGLASGGGNSSSTTNQQVCPNPCSVLQSQITSLVEELKQRYWAMFNDPCNMYNLAPYAPNPNHPRPECRSTFWLGHQQQFMEKQSRLKRLISQADALGCPYDPNADIWASIFPPVMPQDHLDPRMPQ